MSSIIQCCDGMCYYNPLWIGYGYFIDGKSLYTESCIGEQKGKSILKQLGWARIESGCVRNTKMIFPGGEGMIMIPCIEYSINIIKPPTIPNRFDHKSSDVDLDNTMYVWRIEVDRDDVIDYLTLGYDNWRLRYFYESLSERQMRKRVKKALLAHGEPTGRIVLTRN